MAQFYANDNSPHHHEVLPGAFAYPNRGIGVDLATEDAEDLVEGLTESFILSYPHLANRLQTLNRHVNEIYDSFIQVLLQTLKLRDIETREHTNRVTSLTLQLGYRMGLHRAQLNNLRWGALLHDIGKIAIPDAILFKPGKLTPEEWKLMRLHPVYAYQILSGISYMGPAIEIPYLHHEKWDGTGYPLGLKKDAIPLSARIFAIVDVWDALSSKRPYRDAWERDEILSHIRMQSGKHFDPNVVHGFMELIHKGI
ncbi:MAG: HD domain-containing protein [Anaerolineales bacterium]|nr:HD domain-containing protein [Anaerolineales bacterium]